MEEQKVSIAETVAVAIITFTCITISILTNISLFFAFWQPTFLH